MIFHKLATQEKGFAPGSGGGGGKPKYEVDYVRCALGLLVLIILLAAALVCWIYQWTEGSTAILHMAEVVFGGIAGLFFGEHNATS